VTSQGTTPCEHCSTGEYDDSGPVAGLCGVCDHFYTDHRPRVAATAAEAFTGTSDLAQYLSPAERQRRDDRQREEAAAAKAAGKANLEGEKLKASREPYARLLALLSALKAAGYPGSGYVEMAVLLTPHEVRNWPQDKIFEGQKAFDPAARLSARNPYDYGAGQRQWKKDRREFRVFAAKYFTSEERRSRVVHLKYGVTSVVRGWNVEWQTAHTNRSFDGEEAYGQTIVSHLFTVTEGAMIASRDLVARWPDPDTVAYIQDAFEPATERHLSPDARHTKEIIDYLENALYPNEPNKRTCRCKCSRCNLFKWADYWTIRDGYYPCPCCASVMEFAFT
jgi:hypothetical protein